MTTRITNIIKFYRDLYQHEFNTENIPNFYANKVSHIYYPKTFKLVEQADYQLPVDTEWGKEVAAELELNSSERKLVAASFFIKSKRSILGRVQKTFLPIYLHDVILDQIGDVYTIQIDQESISLNPMLLNYLNALDTNTSNQFDNLTKIFLGADNPFDFEGISKLHEALNQKYPGLDVSLLERRIATHERLSDLEKVYRARKENFNDLLLPDIAIGIMDKPIKSKGVINELIDLSHDNGQNYTTLNKTFSSNGFRQKTNANPSNEEEGIVVPISLSNGQESIFRSALTSDFTIVIGPPGTGKSFTIAALAVEAAHKGKKVLIASKNEQACRVVANKISEDIGIKDIHIDASKPHYRWSVASRLRNMANGIGVKRRDYDYFMRLKTRVRIARNSVNRLINEIAEQGQEELKWGKKLAKPRRNILTNLQKQWIKYKRSRKAPIWETKYELHQTDIRLRKLQKQLVKQTLQDRLYKLMVRNRAEVLQLEKAFQERRGNLIKSIFSTIDFDIVLQALPIWICKSSDIADILPLEEDLFDLLIIDEASQCDIASSIPLLHRAKSVVIVGDPNQLRHLSFVSRRKEISLKEKYDLSGEDLRYRDRSILDHVNQITSHQANVIFLDEHYRSAPDIISFSNQYFYDNELKIMTAHPGNEHIEHLKIVQVKGERGKKGENYEEAQQIINRIQRIIKEEQSFTIPDASGIGIISPFRAQIELIKKMVKSVFDIRNIKKHKILIGTPFDFQGEERDIILISMVIDNNVNHGTMKYVERSDVFNVTITRAKSLQEVYISVDATQLKSDSLLANYLHKTDQIDQSNDPFMVYDNFLHEVEEYLQEIKGLKVYIDRIIAGARLDMVVVCGNRTFGIDLVGFPGDYEDQLSIENIKSLERTKIDVFILPFSAWFFDRKSSQEALLRFLGFN